MHQYQMNEIEIEAKKALDHIIDIGRMHLYKPIQIAEILYYKRMGIEKFEISDLETYRNASKRWRDIVTLRLVGRVSTSSQKYQDDLFRDTAVPPNLIAALVQVNERYEGIVENYIYHQVRHRHGDILTAYDYLKERNVNDFSLIEFIELFTERPGLRRSVDKAYEIVVYCLFSVLVGELGAKVTLTLENPDENILEDFNKFIYYVLGVTKNKPTITVKAKLYRAGVTNAADRGLDIWANFGPAVQVKHVSLDEELVEDISSNIYADDIVIVCKDAEAKTIESVLSQVGFPVRGIITQTDLENWYSLCLNKYRDRMGPRLLPRLQQEFEFEFPSVGEIDDFIEERGYDPSQLVGSWEV